VKVLYRQTASDDIVRQFRYYLLSADAPEIAIRFREAVRRAIQSLSQNPYVGPRYASGNPRVQNLRSWPVAGFEAIRIYYALEVDAILIIRLSFAKTPDASVSSMSHVTRRLCMLFIAKALLILARDRMKGNSEVIPLTW